MAHLFKFEFISAKHNVLHNVKSQRVLRLPSILTRASKPIFLCISGLVGCASHIFGSFLQPAFDTDDMSIQFCIEYCRGNSSDHVYAGVSQSLCYCTQDLSYYNMSKPTTKCNTPCTGDPQQICGGHGYVNLFKIGNVANINFPYIFYTLQSSLGQVFYFHMFSIS